MKYQEYQGRYFGFADLTITEVGKLCPEFFSDMALLVTCVDSTHAVSSLDRWFMALKEQDYVFEVIGRAVWISRENAGGVVRDGKTFFGFDEMYLIQAKVYERDLKGSVFTTDGFNFGEELPPDFVNQFRCLPAVRYLSDGCGLNFACESVALVEGLQRIESQIRHVSSDRQNRDRTGPDLEKRITQ